MKTVILQPFKLEEIHQALDEADCHRGERTRPEKGPYSDLPRRIGGPTPASGPNAELAARQSEE